MKLLLCAATEMEIAPTIRYLSVHPLTNIELVITGVGLTAATYSLTKAAAQHQPQFIIQAGIAGYLDEALADAEVVAVKTETVGDVGVFENEQFRSVFDMNLVSSNLFPWTEKQLRNEHEILTQLSLPLVNGVTVNEISTDNNRIQYYRDHLQAQVESMEGAALHYVALMENIAFLQLRSLSNFIGERDKTKWHMKEAIANLNTQLQTIITKYFTT